MPGSLLLDTGKRNPMNKIERLEQENRILRGMLSDIQKSLLNFEENSATGEEHVFNAFKTLGSISYVAGSFSDRMSAEKYRRENTEGERT